MEPSGKGSIPDPLGRLADRVFVGLSSVANLSFLNACRDAAVGMLGFTEAVAAGSRARETRQWRLVRRNCEKERERVY